MHTSLHGDLLDTSDEFTEAHLGEEFAQPHASEVEEIYGDLPSTNQVHYYMQIPNGDENTYQLEDRNVEIDSQFQRQLQEEEQIGDISGFLVLHEIIPGRQRKFQQPLLDFSKSKILTSHDYTKGCQRILAQKEATLAKARQKAEETQTMKETRRKEKEDC